jgi:RNA polymerase sigma-70 factor, ECF subfamily
MAIAFVTPTSIGRRSMNEQERHNLFAELTTRHQGELYGYIYSVVRNWADTDDLYQSVCLVLWHKFDSFRPGSNFFAWARQTAKNKIGDFVRQKQSPTYVSYELLDILAEGGSGDHDADAESYLAALQRCEEKLAPEDNELLQLRYVEELTATAIAERLQRLRQSVGRSLNRVRRRLLECIQIELARQEHSSKELS